MGAVRNSTLATVCMKNALQPPSWWEEDVLPGPGSSAWSGLVDERMQKGSPPSLPALPNPTSSHPLFIPGLGVTELSKQEKMH